jgi:capsular polysaccharide biosynthesis protein
VKEIASLASYCEENNSPITYFYENAPINEFWNIPKTDDAKQHWYYQKYINIKRYKEKPSYVAEIKNAKVETLNGLGSIRLKTKDGRVVKDISSSYEHSVKHFAEIDKLTGTSILLNIDSGSEFFHWLCHLLPKLHLIEKWTPNWEKINKIIFPSGIGKRYHKDALAALQIPEDKILKLKKGESVIVENCVIPSKPGQHIFVNNWVYDFLKKTFLKEEKKYHRKIYISRDRAKGRKLNNEEDFCAHLKLTGFEKIFMEDYNLLEQAQIFNYAKEIICPHGAALANLAYCNPGTKVLEFFSPDYVLPLYWSISNDLGLNYHYMIGEGIRPKDGEDPHKKWANIDIDLEKFIDLYEK